MEALTFLINNGIRPGTTHPMTPSYNWDFTWNIIPLNSDIYRPIQTHMPETYRLLCSLGEHFLRRFITALFARDGHFLALLLAAIWGLKGGFTSLSVQGIFGSGKTYCASLILIVAATVLNLPTLLTAEPNLTLLTAAENISDLLRDAPDDTRAQYARILAQNVPKSTSIDVLPVDRSGLFQTGSPLKCVLITQGSLLRNFCQTYSTLSSFMKTVRLAFSDESQQGGQAGHTVLGANLPSNCLQCLTGDKEQHNQARAGRTSHRLLCRSPS